MAYLNETGLEQVFKEVKSRIEKAKSEASSAGTTAASNVQKNLDDHTKIDNKDNISGAHGYNKNDLNVGFSYKTDTKATTFTAIDGYSNSVSTTVPAASSSNPGLMSIDDKNKLDGIAANANNYSLPKATNSALGGVTIGSNITVSDGKISVSSNNVTSALGYTPVNAASANYVKSLSISGKTITYTKGDGTNGTLTTQDTTYSNATTNAAGLMSKDDKSKLDSLSITNGVISAANLPSYVDDILNFDGILASAPTVQTGTLDNASIGKIITSMTTDTTAALGVKYCSADKKFYAYATSSGATNYYSSWGTALNLDADNGGADLQAPDVQTPKTGKIYIDTTTEKIYRYGGSTSGLVVISDEPDIISTDAVTESAKSVFGD